MIIDDGDDNKACCDYGNGCYDDDNSCGDYDNSCYDADATALATFS